MLSNSVLWNTRHPRLYLPENYHVYLTQDGVSEVLGPGWETEQNWLMSFIDPFEWFTKKSSTQKPFWEANRSNGAGEETAYGGADVDQMLLVKRGEDQHV
jgi:hypothetical protein